MAYPKRITPNSSSRRSLYFDKRDIDVLVRHLRSPFCLAFTRGIRMYFGYGGDILVFSPQRPLTPESTRKHLKGLAVSPQLIELAVSEVAKQAKEGFSKYDQVQYRTWFRILSSTSNYAPAGPHPELEPTPFRPKIKEVVAATPETLAKWDRRLAKCGRTWDDISLSDAAIVRITQELFRVVLGQVVTPLALKERLRRWKRGGYRSMVYEYAVHVFPGTVHDDP